MPDVEHLLGEQGSAVSAAFCAAQRSKITIARAATYGVTRSRVFSLVADSPDLLAYADVMRRVNSGHADQLDKEKKEVDGGWIIFLVWNDVTIKEVPLE